MQLWAPVSAGRAVLVLYVAFLGSFCPLQIETDSGQLADRYLGLMLGALEL